MSLSSPLENPTVIFYRYEESPFAHKIDLLLAIRKIPHFIVLVPSIPPRPELTLLGVDYRRIPVLAINDTVFCDTFKIADALESIHPISSHHPSLFPTPSTEPHAQLNRHHEVLQKIMVQFWTDRGLFQSSIGLLPWTKLPKEFVQDREIFKGNKIDVDMIENSKPYIISQMKVQLELIDQLLEETNQRFLFSTDYPSFLDASVYAIIYSVSQWVESIKLKDDLFGKKDDVEFQKLRNWLGTMRQFYLNNRVHSPSTVISAQEANEKIQEPVLVKEFQPVTPEEVLYGLGNQVAVVPDDMGKVPTVGKLIEIDRKSIALLVKRRDGSGRTCRVSFPRLGFNILPADERAGKL